MSTSKSGNGHSETKALVQILNVLREELSILRELRCEQKTLEERLKMLSQVMLDAQAQTLALLQSLSIKVDELIAQGGGSGATDDEVLSLLGPLASGIQQILERIGPGGGTPPPPPNPLTMVAAVPKPKRY